MSCITIYTDASLCPDTSAGGWACWVRFGKFETMQLSGFFKEETRDSTEAELKAIANAISVVIRRLQPKEKIIVVVTDSAMAIAYIKTGVKKPRHKHLAGWQRRTAIAERINHMIPKGCELRVNKVQGHSKTDGKRSYVNNVVDKAAYKKLQEARQVKAGVA